MLPLREKIAFYLEDIDTPLGKGINLFITGLVLVSSGIFIAETYKISIDIKNNLNAIENVILTIFVIEYALRVWCADRKLQFVFSLYSIIDLLSIAPFLIGT
ncbi:ion transporter, partial [Pseudanabaenaceae cyanobacterium LEGE 13415]|nr:ion transporter [Pseudanabaenaceae cyanobacterium LEGE 13415]